MANHNSIMVSRTLYQMGMITLFAAVTWVGIGIYLAAGKNTVVEIDPAVLAPINPNLDQGVMQKLSDRLKVEVDLNSMAVSSKSASINVIETATQSAASAEGGIR